MITAADQPGRWARTENRVGSAKEGSIVVVEPARVRSTLSEPVRQSARSRGLAA
jgi:hypothetical protein